MNFFTLLVYMVEGSDPGKALPSECGRKIQTLNYMED
jgi:hypothetical protein